MAQKAGFFKDMYNVLKRRKKTNGPHKKGYGENKQGEHHLLLIHIQCAAGFALLNLPKGKV
jgi:hypothetical protein